MLKNGISVFLQSTGEEVDVEEKDSIKSEATKKAVRN
jgi:hypothetical protein